MVPRVWFHVHPHIFHLKYGKLHLKELLLHTLKSFSDIYKLAELIPVSSNVQEGEQKKNELIFFLPDLSYILELY